MLTSSVESFPVESKVKREPPEECAFLKAVGDPGFCHMGPVYLSEPYFLLNLSFKSFSGIEVQKSSQLL